MTGASASTASVANHIADAVTVVRALALYSFVAVSATAAVVTEKSVSSPDQFTARALLLFMMYKAPPAYTLLSLYLTIG